MGAGIDPEISVVKLQHGLAVAREIGAHAHARAPVVEREDRVDRRERLPGRSLLRREDRLVAIQTQSRATA